MIYIALLTLFSLFLAIFIYVKRALFNRIQLGLLISIGLINLYHLARWFYATNIANTNGWDDLIYAVLYLYGSLLFVLVFGIVLVYRWFKKR